METTTTTEPRGPAELSQVKHEQTHSLPGLIRELRDETTMLLRQEVALAKAEMSEKTSRMMRNAVYIALGGVIAYAGLVVLLLACRDLLYLALANNVVEPSTALWLAPLIIGVTVGLVGWAMIAKGKKALSHESLTPEKTIETLREDKEWIQQRAKQKLQRT